MKDDGEVVRKGRRRKKLLRKGAAEGATTWSQGRHGPCRVKQKLREGVRCQVLM